MELNDVIKELEELKARVSELENRITKEELPDISDWAKWVATDYNGYIWAYAEEPEKVINWWMALYGQFKKITPEQAIALCGRVPEWSDVVPIQVKR